MSWLDDERVQAGLARAHERNLARFRPGQAWANGSSVFRILEGPVAHDALRLTDDEGETVERERLALRVERLPLRDNPPAGGEWVDESCFPFLRLMYDPIAEAS